ncbi:MAG: glycosyltransferase [Polyangia bacterium]
MRGEVEKNIRSLHLSGRVSVTGFLSQSDLNAHLEACALLVLPSVSRSEGFGMTQLEAMLFGKPSITTRLPSGVRLVNEHGSTGIQVPPGDARALADALNQLLGNADVRATMGAAASERLETHFSLTQMIGGYRDVYRQALA